jgi:hypothetical protein
VRHLKTLRPPPGMDGSREAVRPLRTSRQLLGMDGLRGLWAWLRRTEPPWRMSRPLLGMGGFKRDIILESKTVQGDPQMVLRLEFEVT